MYNSKYKCVSSSKMQVKHLKLYKYNGENERNNVFKQKEHGETMTYKCKCCSRVRERVRERESFCGTMSIIQ